MAVDDVIKIRSLLPSDAREIGILTKEIFYEIGCSPTLSVTDFEKLFLTPWLEKGSGFVLLEDEKIIGYGWARVNYWHRRKVIHMGLYLAPAARYSGRYQIITRSLLESARALALEFETQEIIIFYRGLDYIHPTIIRELGFQPHPISMLGFIHSLKMIPSVPQPEKLKIRPIDIQQERKKLLDLSEQVFDDQANQGEPIHESYLDIEIKKPKFDNEQLVFAEMDDRLVGYLLLFIEDNAKELTYEIVDFGVLPQWRRQGIGRALLTHALKWIKSRGGVNALAAIFSSNPGLGIFWQLGFRPDPSRTFNFFLREI